MYICFPVEVPKNFKEAEVRKLLVDGQTVTGAPSSSELRMIVREVDERAFVITHPLADVQGGTVRKRALH